MVSQAESIVNIVANYVRAMLYTAPFKTKITRPNKRFFRGVDQREIDSQVRKQISEFD